MLANRRLFHVVTLTLYSLLVAVLVLVFDLSSLYALILFFGIPVVVLERSMKLSAGRLLMGTILIALVFLVIEYFAIYTGAWYTVAQLSFFDNKLSLTQILFSLSHCLYLIVLYEYFFDDQKIKYLSWRPLPVLLLLSLMIFACAYYLFTVTIVDFAFSWLIGLLLGSLAFTILVARGVNQKIWLRILFFVLLLLPWSLVVELIALHTGIRIFAFTSEYLYLVPLFGFSVPLEELVLLLIWPGFVIALYEIFIDDKS